MPLATSDGNLDLLGLTCPQLAAHFQARYGRGMYHAAGLYRAFFRQPEPDLSRLPEFQASSGFARP